MFKRLFNWHHLEENLYQIGCDDRDRGLLPRRQDCAYLNGYLSDRPQGLDGEIQYFPTIEGYIHWKKRY
ncbi:hypothetical protein [Chroococcus sp. FPU101]|uniref:hypothetical protein n=1 Tax=Chroococcus sp. FPU101 TaxID=1974212 RepID=UPI001A8F4769|nr:hypothetical protein [Chroococcus sp. FPU101]GFE67534.1 hypothetical protein CFPU101_01440 [Chroococcus sp. FPU101]